MPSLSVNPNLLGLLDVLPAYIPADKRALPEVGGRSSAAGTTHAAFPARVEFAEARLHGQLSQRALALARVMRNDGRYFEQAYSHALAAKERLEHSGNEGLATEAALHCISVCLEAGDYERALDHLNAVQGSAHDSGDRSLAVRLLVKQATAFLCVEEFEAAARCCEDVQRALAEAAEPALADAAEIAAAIQGFSRCAQSDALERAGLSGQAQDERRRAMACLPVSRPSSPFESLALVIHARAQLGDFQGARTTAFIFLRQVRTMPRLPRWMAQVWMTMGAYYQHLGLWAKGAGRLERAVVALKAAHQDEKLPGVLDLLAQGYAAKGAHVQALHWIKAAREASHRAQRQQSRLRYRLAALERGESARRLEHESALQHARRLAVVGRLMAQIYHALGAPLASANDLLRDGVARDRELDDAALLELLRRVVADIDLASGLTRQLKMFSYRATPQIMLIDLGVALQESWQGLSAGRAKPGTVMRLGDGVAFQVWGDAQRLAVLLRILLIEVDAQAGLEPPSVSLSLRHGVVRVSFPVPAERAAMSKASVGLALCEEMAREMQGRVWRIDGAPGRQYIALELPAER